MDPDIRPRQDRESKKSASPFGDILKEIVRKARPSGKALKGKRLAQEVLNGALGPLAERVSVVSVKTGIATLETESNPLFQELEGYRRKQLIDEFRKRGLNVRELRVRLSAR